ncbi:MAG: hypothetical protein ABI306_00525 [Caulobacteraceae bacterium]
MRSWFRGRTVVAEGGDGLAAYKEGRADERAGVEHDVTAVRVDRGAINDAYDRGRREERLRHRGSPFLALITAILVILALAVLILAVRTGSFAGAGAVLDNLVRGPVQGAADTTGNALQNAGQTVKDRAGSGRP